MYIESEVTRDQGVGKKRLNVVNYVLCLPCWSKEILMQAKNDDDLYAEVKGQKRSNIVNNAIWLPNLVRRTADAS